MDPQTIKEYKLEPLTEGVKVKDANNLCDPFVCFYNLGDKVILENRVRGPIV